jgi:hypothetical protein
LFRKNIEPRHELQMLFWMRFVFGQMYNLPLWTSSDWHRSSYYLYCCCCWFHFLNPFPLEEEAKMTIAQSPLQLPTEDSMQNTLAFIWKKKFNLAHSSSSSSKKSVFHFFFVLFQFTQVFSSSSSSSMSSIIIFEKCELCELNWNQNLNFDKRVK